MTEKPHDIHEQFCWPQLEGLYHQAYCISYQAGIPWIVFVKGMILSNEILRTGNYWSVLVEGYLTKIILADKNSWQKEKFIDNLNIYNS